MGQVEIYVGLESTKKKQDMQLKSDNKKPRKRFLKKTYYKILLILTTEAYLGSFQTSMMKPFCENS